MISVVPDTDSRTMHQELVQYATTTVQAFVLFRVLEGVTRCAKSTMCLENQLTPAYTNPVEHTGLPTVIYGAAG